MSDLESRLGEARSRVARRISELTEAFDAIVDSAGNANLDDEHDPEGSTVAFERSQVSALLERAHEQLAAIDAAIARHHLGTYGICASCREPIPPARLEAQPATRTCVRCATP